jgi:serine/threonine-protein kinase
MSVNIVASQGVVTFSSTVFDLPFTSLLSRVALVLVSAGMYLVARSPRLSRRAKANLGLAYEVVGAATVILIELTIFPAFGLPLGTISTVAIWILLLRVLVPTTLWRASLAAGLSATTVPVVVWGAVAAGYPPVDDWVIAGLLKTSYGTAILAVFASRTVYHLGTAVTEARQLGSYQLEERLGGGGMGEVWRASHRLLQRPAAIKLIRPEILSGLGDSSPGTALRRFENEARVTASLGSTHTVNLFDFGRTDDGAFYYVMELLDGLDLGSMVERYGPVPPERAVFLLAQACHSLMDAHAQGMIHRDVKPTNIFACRKGPDHDFVKVLDFGLVKAMEGEELANPGLTREGMVTGTPAFLAPEIALGSVPIGPATDIYQLGCVGYWLLCGQLVFTGQTPMAMVSQHIHEAPPPLSDRTEIGVPADLERVILDCLAKDPAERPQSAEVLRDRLRACSFEHPWNNQRAAAWWKAHHPTS